MKNGKWLIVHADDFGLSSQVNDAIQMACEHGIVTSVGIIANGVAVKDACQYALAHERVAVGLHFNLTDGRPILPAQSVSSLVDRQGRFYPKNLFIARILQGLVHSDHLRAELTAQAQRLIDMGLPIIHVNSHHHIHALPLVAKVVTTWANEKGISYVRRISTPSLVTWRLGGWRAFVQQWLTAVSMRVLSRQQDEFHGADKFWGFELAVNKNKPRTLRQLIQNLPQGCHELMCHPRFATAQKMAAADDETLALCDPQIRQLIIEKKITLLSTRQFLANC